MMNKYDLFFISIKDFALSLNLVVEKHDFDNHKSHIIDGLPGKNICKSVGSFLSNFASEIEFKNNGLGNALFDFRSILECGHRAREKGIIDDILNAQIVTGWEERTANFEKSDLLFLKYDNLSSSYFFADNNIDNPILHVYWEGGDISSEDIVFTSYVRGAVFWELIRSIKRLPNYDTLKIKRINWLKFYSWLFSNNKNPQNKLITWRYEFNRSLKENKKEEIHLLGVDEFEVEFIKYILKNKGLENVKDIFNPFGALVTFKEYLNT